MLLHYTSSSLSSVFLCSFSSRFRLILAHSPDSYSQKQKLFLQTVQATRKERLFNQNPALLSKTFVSRNDYVRVNNVTYAVVLSVYFLWSVLSLFPSSVHSPSFASCVVCIFSPQDRWTEPHKMVWDDRGGWGRRGGGGEGVERGSARGRRRQRCLI